jgi:hypothetical protein
MNENNMKIGPRKRKTEDAPASEAVPVTETIPETATPASEEKPERRRTFNARFMQDWKNFHFFICDEQTKEAARKLLVNRDYLLPSNMPNKDKITDEAKHFASELVERLKGNRDANKYGLRRIAENVESIYVMQDLSLLYFYIGNLYASARWQMPYNLQRIPVNHDALSMYLSVFTDTFTACIYERKADSGQQEEGQIYENE